jgi:pyrroline-5-carboxylate reductase
MEKLVDKKIGFIGGGKMAEAIFSGLIAAGAVPAENIIVSDISLERLGDMSKQYGIRVIVSDPSSNSGVIEIAKQCDIVFMAVKPQFARLVMQALGNALTENQLVISIVGGLSIRQIAEHITIPTIRVMPNTPMAVQAGVAGIAAGVKCSEVHMALAFDIFGLLGKAFMMPEHLMDALTGISGCGPAYAYMFIEALADGAVKCGLPRDLSYQLAAQTLLGSAKMVLESGNHPAKLKDDVCSPGGATIAGVHTLEQGGFRGCVIDAVQAGVDRMIEVGKKA